MSRGQREKTKLLVEQLHKIAATSAEKLIERLNDPGHKWNNFELNAVTGTMVDKIAKYENWEKKGIGEAGEWVKALVSGLQAAGGGRVSLEVETLPAQDEPKVIDVTRVSGVLEASSGVMRRENASAEEIAQARERWRRARRKRVERLRAREAAQEFVDETMGAEP